MHGTFYFLQERCILDGTLTVNYEQVDVDYRLRHNDLLANIVHRYQHKSEYQIQSLGSGRVAGMVLSTVLFTLPPRNLSFLSSGTRPRCCPSPSTSSISPRTWSSWTSPARSRLVLYSTLQLLPRISNVPLLSTLISGRLRLSE